MQIYTNLLTQHILILHFSFSNCYIQIPNNNFLSLTSYSNLDDYFPWMHRTFYLFLGLCIPPDYKRSLKSSPISKPKRLYQTMPAYQVSLLEVEEKKNSNVSVETRLYVKRCKMLLKLIRQYDPVTIQCNTYWMTLCLYTLAGRQILEPRDD